MLRARAPGALAAVVLALGCAGAGAVQLDRLPAAPVALLERPEREALDRVSALHDLEERQQGSREEGVARLEDLDAMLGGMSNLERRLHSYQGHLALLDPRTGETRRIDDSPPAAQPLAWTPDHRKLLVNGRWRDGVQLFLWDRDKGQFDIVTTGPASHPAGCIGPAGRVVAVEASGPRDDPHTRLVVTPPGGGGLRPLTEGPRDFRPACSPTAPRIAFARVGADGRIEIAVMDLDPPGEPVAVAVGIHPVFTPDGEWIVYAGYTTRGTRLYRVRADGSGRAPLGRGLEEERNPAVSPDGRYVAFVAVGDDKRERVWVRRFDGTGDRPLLGSGDGAMPAW